MQGVGGHADASVAAMDLLGLSGPPPMVGQSDADVEAEKEVDVEADVEADVAGRGLGRSKWSIRDLNVKVDVGAGSPDVEAAENPLSVSSCFEEV